MVISGWMIESEMDYRVANPFITHNLSIVIILFLMKMLQLKALLKKGEGSESFNPEY
jgi:hypothetical protein